MGLDLDSLLAEISDDITANEFDRALKLIRAPIDGLMLDSRTLASVFGSRDLDKLCLDLGKNLLALENISATNEEKTDATSFVFVVSELYMTGGHTAIVEDYIRALSPHKARILITDPNNSKKFDVFARLSKATADIRFSPSVKSAAAKLRWLLQELANSQADWCFFVHHPNDPVAVAAMQKSVCKKIAFVHHVDHHFALGLFANPDLHIDFRHSGWRNCRTAHGIANNLVVPLTCTDYGCPDAAGRFMKNGTLVSCTSGNNKFESAYSYKLIDLIPQWLSVTGGTHIHIGNLSQPALEGLSTNMEKAGLNRNQLRLIPWVESLWKTLLQMEVDLYIDSFPICGCRALVEAMGAGVPIAVHQNYMHKLLSNESFAPTESLKWRTPAQLADLLRELQSPTLEKLSTYSRKYYESNHSLKLLSDCLRNGLNQLFQQCDDNDPYYEIDDFRTSFDLSMGNIDAKKLQDNVLLSYLIVKELEQPTDQFDRFLEEKLPLPSVETRQILEKAKNQLRLSKILERLYPIFNEGAPDFERLSKLLYQISLIERGNIDRRRKNINLSTKAKVLYNKTKSKVKNRVKKILKD